MRRTSSLVVVALLLAACTDGAAPGAATSSGAAAPVTSPPASAAGGTGKVTVEIVDLAAARGSDLVAILYDGTGSLVGPRQGSWDGLGGFVVPVLTDPFSVARTLQEGSPLLEDYPGSGADAAVPEGTHTMLVAVSSHLSPYSEWYPAAPLEQGCELLVTVTADETTVVRLTGLPPWDETDVPTCTPA